MTSPFTYYGSNRFINAPERQAQNGERAWLERRANRRVAALSQAPNQPLPGQLLADVKFDCITDFDLLFDTYRLMRQSRGQSAGPDGVRFDDLGQSEVADMIRRGARSLRNGAYRPQPTRACRIPKSTPGQFRTLQIANLFDRLVARRLNDVLAPRWDMIFLDGNWGFRPRRNVWGLLARLETEMSAKNAWFLITDDVRDAFDHIPLAPVLTLHREQNPAPELYNLLEAVIHSGADYNRAIGVSQGSAYSPTSMNVFLHHVHDRNADVEIPVWARFADNLIYAARTAHEGTQIKQRVSSMLQTQGLQLRGSTEADLLREQRTRILGFEVSQRDGEFCMDIGREAWSTLAGNLRGSHETDNPIQNVVDGIRGWIAYFSGPTALDTEKLIDTVLRMAALAGYPEFPWGTRQVLLRLREATRDAWFQLKREMQYSRHPGTQLLPLPLKCVMPAAPPATNGDANCDRQADETGDGMLPSSAPF